MSNFTPWTFFNDIGNSKKMIIDEIGGEKAFRGRMFVVMRALSFHIDSVLIVEKLNQLTNMSPRSLYQVLSMRIRKQNRKWLNDKCPQITPELEIIQRHYGYSYEKAVSAQKLLSDEFIQSLIVKYDVGGANRTPRKKRK